ncbi:MAG TPA: Flp family type IVb pilin [Geomonas sp.]|nr:Flp family type IVb pilin [Geomonas sp.]
MLAHLRKMSEKAQVLVRNESGQGLVEYALILVLIAIVVIAAVKGIGSQANSTFSAISSGMAH